MDTLEEVQDAVRASINQLASMFIHADRKQLEDTLKQRELKTDNIYEICDTYVSERTYDMTFFKVCSVCKVEDSKLMSAIAKVKYLDLSQMGLHWHCGFNISKAILEFRNIAVLRTPWEKMECLVRSIRILSEPYQTEVDPRNNQLQG